MIRRSHLVFASLLLLAVPVAADEPFSKISGPFTEGNLSVFMLHGKDAIKIGGTLLTLQEALDQKKLIVHETSDVNELAVENVSTDADVFLQSGDIVKGGRQDRLIACDMIVPPKSGRVPIGSFCCEHGRWQQRGSESAGRFEQSAKQAGNRDVKLAVNCARDQSTVWSKVKEAQSKLDNNVGKPVANAQSPSSYQLSLEDKELLAKLDAYKKELKKLPADHADAIGFVIVINGKVAGADMYGSHALFAKLWPKLLEGAAVDALSEFDAKKRFGAATESDVRKFLADAGKGNEKGIIASIAGGQRQHLLNAGPAAGRGGAPDSNPQPKQQAAADPKPDSDKPGRCRVVSTENDKSILLEAKDRKDNSLVHRSYIAK